MIPTISKPYLKTRNKLLFIVACISLVLVLLLTLGGGLRASAATLDWEIVDTSPYAYYPISISAQYDNVNFTANLDTNGNYTGNFPSHTAYNTPTGADVFVSGHSIGGPYEGNVVIDMPVFAYTTTDSAYLPSFPTFTFTGDVNHSNVTYVFTCEFEGLGLDGETFATSYTRDVIYTSDTLDVTGAWNDFTGYTNDSMYTPITFGCVVTNISVLFRGTGNFYVEVTYGDAPDLLSAYPKEVVIDPPDPDIMEAIEEAYRQGKIDGRELGYQEGRNDLEGFSPITWILNMLQGILDFEILPFGDGITVGAIVATLISVPFIIWFLKLFAGG